MATRSQKPVNSGKRSEPIEVFTEVPKSSLASYLNHWIKFGAKQKEGSKAWKNELESVLTAAKEDLTETDYATLESNIAPHIEEKRNEGKRAKKGEGLSRSEWRLQKFEQADVEGIWYPGHPDGCTSCGSKERKHYSGGRCTRCYTQARNERLGITREREEARKAKEQEKADKLAQVEKEREERAKAKLEAQTEKEKVS